MPKRALAAATGKRKGPSTTSPNGTFSPLLVAARPRKKTKTRATAAAAALAAAAPKRLQHLVANNKCPRQVLDSSTGSRYVHFFFFLPFLLRFFSFSSYPLNVRVHNMHSICDLSFIYFQVSKGLVATCLLWSDRSQLLFAANCWSGRILAWDLEKHACVVTVKLHDQVVGHSSSLLLLLLLVLFACVSSFRIGFLDNACVSLNSFTDALFS